MALNLDMSFFSIICDLGNCLYSAETDLEDMKTDRIVADIRSGQLENVQAVLEFNPAEGWCNDVTSAVLAEALSDELPCSTEYGAWSDYSTERVDGHRAGVVMKAA